MTDSNKNWILILVFVCGILAGFGIHSLVFPQYQNPVKHVIVTGNAPKPIGPYSQAVQYGDFVFISGQIGLDPTTGNLSDTVDGQTLQVMENLRSILKEAGLGFSDVVQTRIYITNMTDWDTVNGIYGRYFENQYPARATVQIAGLPKGAKVEIEVIAQKS
jgi:2-iminobutanoate/2-iminopropanoate deaminase